MLYYKREFIIKGRINSPYLITRKAGDSVFGGLASVSCTPMVIWGKCLFFGMTEADTQGPEDSGTVVGFPRTVSGV